MEQEKKDQRITVMMSESELTRIDEWAHENRIKSRGEAMRLLLNSAFSLIPSAERVSEVFSRMEDFDGAYFEEQGLLTELRQAVSSVAGSLWMIRRNTALQAGGEPVLPTDRAGHSQTKTEMLVIFDILDTLVSAYSGEADTSSFEDEVISMIERGKTDGEISDTLGISDKLGKTYVELIKRKVGASDRDQIADFAPVSVEIKNPYSVHKPRAIRLEDKGSKK